MRHPGPPRGGEEGLEGGVAHHLQRSKGAGNSEETLACRGQPGAHIHHGLTGRGGEEDSQSAPLPVNRPCGHLTAHGLTTSLTHAPNREGSEVGGFPPPLGRCSPLQEPTKATPSPISYCCPWSGLLDPLPSWSEEQHRQAAMPTDGHVAEERLRTEHTPDWARRTRKMYPLLTGKPPESEM